MSNVFANGMEVSAKKDDNKSICAMADVCLSPPSPPAGPVPIPYPNTAVASDTSEGSKTVKIGGQEVGLKNKSNYKTSKGDEAATRALGMGVVSHTIQGKMKHASWSMDVKIEGENVIRHMDLTTHNHINQGNLAVVLNQAKQKIASGEPLSCAELDALNQEARNNDVNNPPPPAPPRFTQFTLTTASFTGGGRSSFRKATAPGRDPLIKSGKRNEYAGTNRKETMACTDEPYGGERGAANAVENNMTRNHAEPKLIEFSFQPGGPLGSLKMKTHHQMSPENADAMPCDTCRPAICKAVQCELEILLCNDKNEEVNAEDLCDKDTGEPRPQSEWAARGLG
jgi:hypothetical protein